MDEEASQDRLEGRVPIGVLTNESEVIRISGLVPRQVPVLVGHTKGRSRPTAVRPRRHHGRGPSLMSPCWSLISCPAPRHGLVDSGRAGAGPGGSALGVPHGGGGGPCPVL